MKNQWVTFLGGKIHVKVEGNGVERFINQLTRSHLLIWNVKRQGEKAITFYIRLQDLNKLRHQARKFDCRVSFLSGQGVPFLWKRTLKNGGFLTGLILFFIVITMLSNVVWGIDIKGASPQTEHQIKKELNNMGIQIGKLQFNMDSLESIQHELTNKVPNITWVGVDLHGTTFHLHVVEKNTPKTKKPKSPRHLVANQKAVIVDMFVEAGIPVVKVNQFVNKGQLLVSGLIGREEDQKPVAAIGKVYGKTWYKSDVELPLQSDFQVFTGKEHKKYTLKMGSLSIPFWGFGKIKYKEYEKENNVHQIKFLKWDLPIKYVQTTVREKQFAQRDYTKDQAISAAKELAKNDLRAKIPNDAKIVDEYVLHEKVEHGKVKLSMYFQVIEDIAEAKPITQGD
ncbi:sporulation protein YqfD [Bacillus sp. FJAT-49736]|uniref:sporulation protein YqfD n=1 Tax=Bacillus sp. FJAT-49736 TaxID=2833582 RepID=UPI001BC97229|nr:sporulation protein YqfD [Bacillus sp. FJAT-49736]MBS4173577.1 sporulation protein YqfD [Bacillus sp. FJAT-49736]